jgi:hypothetical protein
LSYFNEIRFSQSETLDGFGRVRVSTPTTLFDAQFTYGLNSLLYQQIITSLGGEALTHDTTNSCANMAFTATPNGGECYMQTYDYLRYQPGKSQEIFVTFNFIEAKANCLKFAGYSDPYNGIQFQLNGLTKQFVIYSGTGNGNQTATQANWNVDKFDGTGPSGLTLDIEKTQIFYIDLQALYVGEVRVGFNINGKVFIAHEFKHANLVTTPYIKTANLPIRCGMVCTNTVTTSMKFICCSVISEGGQEDTVGYSFVTPLTMVTAASGARTHLISIEPKLTFNSITNRSRFVIESVDLLVVGNNPVFWELCLGQALTGSPTKTDVNPTYSAMQYSTSAVSGSPAIVIDSGFVAATNQTKTALQALKLNIRYPLTLNAAGTARDLGRLTLLVQGIGGTSDTYGQLKWREIR